MTFLDPVSHLQAVTSSAKAIREHLGYILEAHGDKVHFRPTASGVTMIGLDRDTPQRGQSFGNVHAIAADFDALFARYCVGMAQGRSTPEKELQSWLISRAYRNKRRMVPIEIQAARQGNPVELLFMTDEIPVNHPTKGKKICDLLALRRLDDGTYRAVDMELKSKRAMKEIVGQVEDYSEIVDRYQAEFAALFSALVGHPVVLSGSCEKWIVWPMPRGHKRDPREDELADEGIRVVSYVAAGKGYSFTVGAPAW